MQDERFCAICERKLDDKDSDHVCRGCFRRAREPKTTVVELSDDGAERLGFALAVGDLLNWGVRKLVESSGVEPPPAKPPPDPDEAARVREKLEDIQRRLKDDPEA